MQLPGSDPIRDDVRAFYEDSIAALLAASPEVATEMGVVEIGDRPIPQDVFSDISPAGEERRRTLMAGTLTRLRKLPAMVANPRDDLNREIYEFFLRWGSFGRLRGTESHSFSLCDSIADHLSGVQTELVTCLAQWQRLNSIEDADCFLSRLQAVPRQIDNLIEGLRERNAAGNVMPACIVRRVVDELSQLLALPTQKQPIYLRFLESGRITSAERVATALECGFLPAFHKLHALLTGDYSHEDRIGLCRLRDGEGLYRFLLKAHTTTDLSVADIHALGVQELERLQQTTREKLRAAGYGGDSISEGFEAFDRDERFQLARERLGRNQLLQRLEAIIAETTGQVMPLFGIQPQAHVTVRPIPEVQEANRHMTYVPPSPDGARCGTFEVNLAQLQATNRLDLHTLVYHETIPGHHLQLTIAQELGAVVPSFRKVLVHDGYMEGWAKYAEVLPRLTGINTDPCWDIARSRMELYSTANLALDTGIHAMGWTRDQSVTFFAHNTGCSREFAAGNVDRIIARPAQVCAYKIGMMTMLDARKRMKRALGERFDIRRFHDVVLGQGSMPLALLDRVVDAEIERLRRC
ncbi:MAG: DUF885 domain-containing protein [Steroidobacteraceae bacterium]